MTKAHLFGMNLAELQAVAAQAGLPKFAAKQMADWLYKKNISDIAQMTNVSVKGREAIAALSDVGRMEPTLTLLSADGTRKMLFDYGGKAVETAYIPDGREERNTLCVSSQVGCKMACRFCMTGRQGFTANLTAGEILNQMADSNFRLQPGLGNNITFVPSDVKTQDSDDPLGGDPLGGGPMGDDVPF